MYVVIRKNNDGPFCMGQKGNSVFMFGSKKINGMQSVVKASIMVSEPMQAITKLKNIQASAREDAKCIRSVESLLRMTADHISGFYDDFASTYQDDKLLKKIAADRATIEKIAATIAGTSIAIFWYTLRGMDDRCMKSVRSFIKRLGLSKQQSEVMEKAANHYLTRVAPQYIPMEEMVLPRELLAAMLLDNYTIDPRLSLGCYLRIKNSQNYIAAVNEVPGAKLHEAATMLGVFD